MSRETYIETYQPLGTKEEARQRKLLPGLPLYVVELIGIEPTTS